jgi:hypothetical protein
VAAAAAAAAARHNASMFQGLDLMPISGLARPAAKCSRYYWQDCRRLLAPPALVKRPPMESHRRASVPYVRISPLVKRTAADVKRLRHFWRWPMDNGRGGSRGYVSSWAKEQPGVNPWPAPVERV